MRWLGIFALGVFTAACSTDRCKQGTVFLSYTLTNGAQASDTIDVALAIAGGETRTMSVPRKTHGSSGSIEVDFTSYPTGQSLAFTLKRVRKFCTFSPRKCEREIDKRVRMITLAVGESTGGHA